MRFIFGIPILLFGSFLLSLTVSSFGNVGNAIMNVIGFVFLMAGALIISRRKVKEHSS
ncbi:hypothetical protein [Halalkalibacter krulwichiae]|uniref:Uncharacterized protein n=1 Tax=Halalkalibacter krulwichiae TaxID=199441 RepID=A0A1X9M979_9BACI|nr:hypothetical protein [Halalkalibacter krulwichiae]ARK29947.1 hypothetical protein BkAM31D_08760 [Halalkalibacter krulwichiae]